MLVILGGWKINFFYKIYQNRSPYLSDIFFSVTTYWLECFIHSGRQRMSDPWCLLCCDFNFLFKEGKLWSRIKRNKRWELWNGTYTSYVNYYNCSVSLIILISNYTLTEGNYAILLGRIVFFISCLSYVKLPIPAFMLCDSEI